MSQLYTTMNVLIDTQSYLILINKVCNFVFCDQKLCFHIAWCDFCINNSNKKLNLVK